MEDFSKLALVLPQEQSDVYTLALEISWLTKLQWNLLFSMKKPLLGRYFSSDISLWKAPFSGPNCTLPSWEKGNDIEAFHPKKTNLRSFENCVKYRNITNFPGAEILWKGTVSTKFRANRPKLYGSCAFPQTLYARKFAEITVFYAVKATANEGFISRFNLYREQVYFLVWRKNNPLLEVLTYYERIDLRKFIILKKLANSKVHCKV